MAQTTHTEAPQTKSVEEIRDEVSLADGQVVRVEAKGGDICLSPDLRLSSDRGFLAGMAVDDVRDKTDRF